MNSTTVATAKAEPMKFPSQIKYIVGNEACERFSYYGMRAILTIFMTDYLMKEAADAKSMYHFFIQAAYFTPLLGAYLSDRFLGKYRTIFWLSIVYCVGHLVLSIYEDEAGLMWGLGLIALGSGGIKPCVSAHVGDQFTDKNKGLLEKVYSLFYFSINFGAFFSSLLTPFLLVKYGPSLAFGVPGILMAIATFVFWLGRQKYVHVPPVGKNGSAGFFKVFWYSLRHRHEKRDGDAFFDVAKKKFMQEEVEAAKAVVSIFKVFFAVSGFWALFEQQGSTWTLQAKQMDLNVLGMKLEASQIQALNPILVMLLIPVFTFGIYPLVAKMGVKVTPLRKMGVGMVMTGLSFVMVGIFQSIMDNGTQLNVMWQLAAYVVLTCSEVMVSITGLEFAYTQAPRAAKSTIMSFWLLTVSFGNFLAAIISKLNYFTGAGEFFFYAGLMGILALVFVWQASKYKTRNYVEAA